MNKKLIALLVCAFALCLGMFALVGCSGGSGSSDASASSDQKTLIVGFDAEYPPYGYMVTDGGEGYVASDGNTYTGFDLDMAAEVCERNGWEFVVEPINWDSKDALLGSGTINCIWNGFTMEGREGQYAFSDPYMENAQVVVVKADSDIASLDDLAGKNVITQADSAAYDLLSDGGDNADLAATFAKFETISDYNNAFMQLEAGAVDAVVCDLSVAISHINAKPDAYKQLDEQLNIEHYAAGFAADDTETADAVTATLKEMYADGTIDAIAKKYGDDIDMNLWCLN